jgi:hypothetical protein
MPGWFEALCSDSKEALPSWQVLKILKSGACRSLFAEEKDGVSLYLLAEDRANPAGALRRRCPPNFTGRNRSEQ